MYVKTTTAATTTTTAAAAPCGNSHRFDPIGSTFTAVKTPRRRTINARKAYLLSNPPFSQQMLSEMVESASVSSDPISLQHELWNRYAFGNKDLLPDNMTEMTQKYPGCPILSNAGKGDTLYVQDEASGSSLVLSISSNVNKAYPSCSEQLVKRSLSSETVAVSRNCAEAFPIGPSGLWYIPQLCQHALNPKLTVNLSKSKLVLPGDMPKAQLRKKLDSREFSPEAVTFAQEHVIVLDFLSLNETRTAADKIATLIETAPEYKKESVSIGNSVGKEPPVMGSFGGMGTSSVNYHPSVMDLRKKAFDHLIRPIVMEFICLVYGETTGVNDWYIREVLDRIVVRKGGIKNPSEKPHRDNSENVLEHMVQGWINLSQKDQVFHCYKGTAFTSLRDKVVASSQGISPGFNPTNHPDDLDPSFLTIKPGQVVLFMSDIIHSVAQCKVELDETYLRLHVACAFTTVPSGDLGQTERLVRSLRQMSLLCPSGCKAPLWPSLYWTNHVQKLVRYYESCVVDGIPISPCLPSVCWLVENEIISADEAHNFCPKPTAERLSSLFYHQITSYTPDERQEDDEDESDIELNQSNYIE